MAVDFSHKRRQQSGGEEEATTERDGLLKVSRKLEEGNQKLEDAKRTVLETEDVALGVMRDLTDQREVINQTREHFSDLDEQLTLARRAIQSITRRLREGSEPSSSSDIQQQQQQQEEVTFRAPTNVLNSQLDRLWSMLTEHNGQLADVWIYTVEYVGARASVLPAHKCILAAGCPALIKKIDPRRTSSCTTADSSSEDFGETKKVNSDESAEVRRLDFTDVAPTWAVSCLLRYIYGQPVHVEPERLSVLYMLAKEMRCGGLEEICKQKIIDFREKLEKFDSGGEALGVGKRQRSPESDSSVEPELAESSVKASTSSQFCSGGISKVDESTRVESVQIGPPDEGPQICGAVTEGTGMKADVKSSSSDSFLDMIRNSGSLPQLDRGRMISTPGAFDKKYELISSEDGGILGEGMNGAVRLAKDRITGDRVAVKFLSLHNLSPVKRDMLYDEINIYLPLSHPNIVLLNEVYEELGERIILVMEACTGGELYERLAKLNRYSERDAAKILRHILYAVSYLHSLNICHRDIKLENFVYTDDTADARLKLCDFGFGTIVHQKGDCPLTAAMGSIHYVAPEVLEGRYGLQCDMWSVGVILYMLLNGTPPFDGADDGEIAEAVRHAPLKLSGSRWDGISWSAKDLIRKLICRDPSKRLTAREALQHEWCGSTDILKLNTAPTEIDTDILRTMHAFTKCSAIQRAALGLIAQKRGDEFEGIDENLKSMEAAFRRMDTNNDGVITLAEFEDAVRSHVDMSEHEAEKIFGEISSSSSAGTEAERVIHYRDFLAATVYSLRNREIDDTPRESSGDGEVWRWNSDDIRSAYEAFDVDRKGYVTKEDLLNVLGCGGRELKRILEAAGFDPGRTHRVDVDDFSRLLNCSMGGIVDFPRLDSTSEAELLKDTKTAELLERNAYLAGLDEYDEGLLVANGICATSPSPGGGGMMMLRPSRRQSDDDEGSVETFLRRMRTWPLFYPLYRSYALLPGYSDDGYCYNYNC
ncbi:calcium-dependent protein kinase, putative [Perkinsus marinus ATCC 50983]|uniref:Calcium-dependent protein kinase, putative n=1 Tax=Perkinsus marinus (strain ATCC 50983 / TXsc) TaxID=423536 RepID=C5KQB0_PERM5|nr:calcium-dependent protein kinase, putative [Perkinsus marinus ATCC 50983]EER13332.1 calcium-dependent protein kinase, putative [Perkinsus marinus ATCC 50983]|eukprot:XP_002781537.1 calcium-dependent protein kinase, putative [Perkinsus marinus ATCC 50983]